ncbi:MAG: queuosine precursor transporter [Patescibacteria group bacterium]|nr:queuosine precursor transporter [Patescibacteria group bacterium]
MKQQLQNLLLQNSRNSNLLLVFSSLFIASLLSANIIAVKIISIFGFFLPAGVIVFPISYILGDVLTEVYGYRKTKLIIWLGFFANLFLVLAIISAQHLQSAPFWDDQIAFDKILGYTPRLLTASFIAYLIGSFANSFVMSKMKIITQGRWLWSRTVGSTVIGEGLDSLLFITIAFIGTIPFSVLGGLIVTQWVFKVLYEVVMTPVTYKVVSSLKNIERKDVYDYEESYNPFALI